MTAAPSHVANVSHLRQDGFSLLIPVYAGDDVDQLRLAIESSTADQTLPPAEVVIVQDGPVNDDVAAFLRDLPGALSVPVTLEQLPENRGLTEALNAGLARVSYAIVARMDADDVSLADRFERQWALMQAGYDLVGTGMIEFEHDPAVTSARRIPPVGAERIREHARTHNPFNHPTMMYRLAAIRRVGGYEAFGKMEDYWLGVRLIADGARVENIADPLVKYRVGAGAFHRRGGWQEARTEARLQRAMLGIGFITPMQYVRNVAVKGLYRLLPASIKRVLFRRFVAAGLRGDRA